MRVGAFVPIGTFNANADFLRALGPQLEERGFESVWLAEHVVLFDEYESRYPYADNGRFPGGGDTGLLEPLTGLAYLAAVTDTVRLGTAVCLVPQRNPVYTAKQVVDVDVLSGGRVEFGIGIGWLREEFEALGMPFERRAARTREHIEVMKALWTEDVAEYHGELYDLPPCRLYPKPAQQPHPPILVGGESDAALRRVVELGQGWFGFDRAPEDVPEAMVRLEKLLDEHDRDRADISVTVCPYLKPIGDGAMEQYAEAGVDRVVLPVLAFDAARLPEQLDRASAHLERARSL